jgi:Transglutaminase-like superfamily
MDRLSELRGPVEDAHRATRSVIEGTGCQLGASLLALALGRLGKPAEYVVGHYVQPGEVEMGANEHAWVEVDGVILDPTRDQFGENPLIESYDRRYVERERKPAGAMADQVYLQLALQWRIPARQDSILKVVQQYGLDVDQLELRSANTYTMRVVGRSDASAGQPEEHE